MAVLIEGVSVVVRREVIVRRYEGGWRGFAALACDIGLCADSDLARVGFMHPDDVEAFVQHLEQRGFLFSDKTGAAVDIVVVDQGAGPTTPCPWIEFFRHEVPGGMVSAARLAGSREQKLICPEGWMFEGSLSERFRRCEPTDMDKDLEFVRRDQETEVFRDRRTSKEFYLTDPSAQVPRSEVEEKAARQRHAALWKEAGQLVGPYVNPAKKPSAGKERANVIRGTELLQQLTSLETSGWQPWWLLGIAFRALADRERAYAAFARAYSMAPNEIEVGRNFAAECMALSRSEEAIKVAAATAALAPDNAGLRANYALALLLGGDVNGALREVQRGEQSRPIDDITKNLRKLIERVRAGKVKMPLRFEDL